MAKLTLVHCQHIKPPPSVSKSSSPSSRASSSSPTPCRQYPVYHLRSHFFEKMDSLAKELADAHSTGNGYQVAQVLLPLSPPDKPGRLQSILKSTNAASVKKDVSRALRKSSYLKDLPDDELTGWVDIITAYWKAVSEIAPMVEPVDTGKVDRPSMSYL